MKTFFAILLWLWQAPQCLLGLVLRLIYIKGERLTYRGVKGVYDPRFRGGISLGNVILLHCPVEGHKDTWNHEWGHTRQSRMLGPLYLLVIGIPSFVWACVHKYDPKRPYSYYTDCYCERWADKLGGVKRS